MGLRSPLDDQLRLQKLEELQLLEAKINLQENLPHLHGWKLYQWGQEYWDALQKIQIICAGNQVSKSSTQIRKHIHLATAVDEWPMLWNTKPLQFWYLYPSRDVAHVEFTKKWIPEFMPRGEFQEHPQYGWKPEWYHGRIFAVHWNSGISTYFKTYNQDVQDLQTGTVSKLDLDEETPAELMPELFMRLAATDGYLSAVFTPTLGQEYWREAVEENRFPDAFVRQVSMYDCLKYADGTPSPWTIEKIRRAENSCKSPQEIEKRIYGRFTVSEGLKYPSFHRIKNRKKGHPLPKDWSIWCGVDPGSGGVNHPAAICLVGVSPDWRLGRVFSGWRGDNEVTTAADIVAKTIRMIAPFPNVRILYDYACRDFYQIATDMGLQVEGADKSHTTGETILNVLFKNQILMVYDYPELDPLVHELASLRASTPKNRAKDDFVDALRYAVSKVPWDFKNAVSGAERIIVHEPKKTAREIQEDARRALVMGREKKLVTIDDELAYWDAYVGAQFDDYGSY